MSKDKQILHLFGQLQHSLSATHINFQSIVERSVEIDASGAVDDHVAALDEFLFVLFGQSEALLQKVALAQLGNAYMGCTLAFMNSSNFAL